MAGSTDRGVLDMFTDKTRPGGHIMFFAQSAAWDAAKAVVAEWEKARPIARVEDFKSLVVYRKTR